MAEKRPRPGSTLSFDWTLPPSPPPPPAPPASDAPPPSADASPPASRDGKSRPASGETPPPPSADAKPPASRDASSAPASGLPVRPPEERWEPPPLPERRVQQQKAEPRVLTVAQLGRVVGRSLERTFVEDVWVEGEVSGARPASSGHVYFAMKDESEEATLDVVLYRSQVTPRARALVKDGARVRVRGKPTYWAPRGKLQFVGDRVEPTGKGALLEALQKLKEKLHAEGLFSVERKRPLPRDPRVIGVVTSASGAVIHDVCKVAFRRGNARILLAPAQVQGAGAADSIRRALRMLQKVAVVDVIIIGRGGGSQDDLLAFNDEALVRDVAACRVPIVSAVGHEVDVTLVDFAADARAATPSQAAEMIVPDATARRHLLEERSGRLRRAILARIGEDRVTTARLAQAFGDPRLLIASAQQRIDEHTARLERIAGQRLSRERDAVSRLSSRLGAAHPRERIARDHARLGEALARLATSIRGRLRHRSDRITTLARHLDAVTPRVTRARQDNLTALAHRLDAVAPQLARARRESLTALAHRLDAVAPEVVRARQERLSGLAARLDAMSPLKVLARGYAIVTRAEDGRAVRDATEVAAGDAVHVRVATGSFEAAVTRKEPS